MQTVPRSPHDSAPVEMTLSEISYHYAHDVDHVLRDPELGQPSIRGVEVSAGYIRYFYQVSHPRMILPNQEVHVSRPPEQEALDEIAVEEDGDQGYLELSRTLTRIRNHVYVVMSSGVIAQGSAEWVHLEEVLRELHGGRVY